MGHAAAKPTMTPEAFLAWEAQQPERHELVGGEVFAMAGADERHNTLTLNLATPFFLAKRLIPDMQAKRFGRIINITSVSGQAGNAGQANYSSAKAGMIGLTKATAREVASRGITVNAVAPGFITTELTADLPDAIKEGVKAQTPLGRFGEPQEIAAAVVYLASREASYVTGQVLGVDGGLVMM